MTSDTTSSSSRHLLDPALAAAVDLLPALDVTSHEGIVATRALMSQPNPAAPDPDALFPDTVRDEIQVAGRDGQPNIRVVTYAHTRPRPGAAAYLWFHGGGYVFGRTESDEITLRRIVSETGTRIFNVDYRLAPESTAPAPLDDAYAVLAYVHENADSLGIDRRKVVVGGNSAGGGLAASLSTCARDRGKYAVGLQLLLQPMLDDRTASTAEAGPYAGEFLWKPEFNRFAWQAFLGVTPGGPDTSPYSAPARVEDPAGLPTTYIAVGALDLFAEENIEYARRLMRAGVPTELHLYPGAFHGFSLLPHVWTTQSYLDSMLASLKRFLEAVAPQAD